MMGDRRAKLILLLILSFVLVSLPQIGVVKAEGTIYIRTDGSVEGTDSILHDGNVYTFTGNINGSVVVERDNVVVDGAGFLLQGTDWDCIGVDLSSRKNVTVKNIEIKGCGYDIRVFDSSNCSISDNTHVIIHAYYPNGVFLNKSSNNIISGNHGLTKLVESDNNILLSNSAGIKLSRSSNNTLSGNKNSIELSESSNNSISENNSSIKFYTQSNGNIVFENTGFIGLWESSNNSIIGNNGAILIIESNNNTVIQNTVKDNRPYGIQLGYSSGNIFSENIIQNNKLDIRYVFNNIFYHNDFVNATIDIVDDSAVFWDNGSEGNYWDNYTGLDNNSDGIGDTPYILNENNQDNYPLMEPVIIPEFPVWTPLLILLFAVTALGVIYKRKIHKTPIH